MLRTLVEELATVRMLEVTLPTIVDRKLLLVRLAETERDVLLLFEQLGLHRSPQPLPCIRTPQPM